MRLIRFLRLSAPLAAVLLCLAPDPAGSAETHPAQALIERSAIAIRADPEDGRRGAEQALALLKERPDPDLEIRARLLLCEYYAERDRVAAGQEASLAKALLPRAARRGLRAGVLACQGEILEIAGDNPRAEALYAQAASVASLAGDDEMLAGALFQRGFVLGLRGEYSAGLTDLRRAEALYEHLDMRHHALTTLCGIATLYNRMGDYAQARTLYARALPAQEAAGMRREVIVTRHNLARAYERLGEWEAARQAFAGSLALSQELGYRRGEAYALRGLGAIAIATGDPSGALKILERASVLQRRTPDARLRAQIQLARGMALHALGRLGESVTALEDAVGVFLQGDSLGDLGAAYAEIAAVHAQTGNWRAAFEWQSESKAASEKLLRNQLDQRFASLKVEFDTAATQKENALLLRENQANEQALAQGRRVRQLQAVVIGLTAALLLLLVWLVIHQRRSTLRMRELAMTDELTGVPNRRAVLRRLDRLLHDTGVRPCSILIVDIDHFKSINDRLGHPTGDEVLKVVAAQLRTEVREPVFFGRLGGEEFLIVLPAAGQELALATADRIRQGVNNLDTSRWFTSHQPITASVGVATTGSGPETPSSMLQRADAALYEAKRAGRNCVWPQAQDAGSGSAELAEPLPA